MSAKQGISPSKLSQIRKSRTGHSRCNKLIKNLAALQTATILVVMATEKPHLAAKFYEQVTLGFGDCCGDCNTKG